MIVSVVGARPQFVKAAVVSKALAKIEIPEVIIHTGQHYDDKMSRVFWEELEIPDVVTNLAIGSGSQSSQTALMMIGIEKYINEMQTMPRIVMVYGDTNSTLATSLVASKFGIPVVHVEAGLRSYNRDMPEEINRIVTDHLSSLLFCSSAKSVEILMKEGISERVFDVGDVMMDALRTFNKKAEKEISIHNLLGNSAQKYNLLTVHRPSNTDNLESLNNIIEAINDIGESFVWPLHPRLKPKLSSLNIPDNLKILNPFSYLEMLSVLANCNKVFTDSGGLQKEAYWMKKPCITLRNETEWVETLHNNWNVIAGNKKETIFQSSSIHVNVDTWKPLYGDGFAAEKIANKIHEIYY